MACQSYSKTLNNFRIAIPNHAVTKTQYSNALQMTLVLMLMQS